jgi:hypothetical protein
VCSMHSFSVSHALCHPHSTADLHSCRSLQAAGLNSGHGGSYECCDAYKPH